MTIVAESFTGRVLAVFSRRSPGFRPPLKSSGPLPAPSKTGTPRHVPVEDAFRPRETPQVASAQNRVTKPGLADVTARWKSISPRERLQHRVGLLAVVDSLDSAAGVVGRDSDFALSLVRDLDRVRDGRAFADLAHDLDLAGMRARTIASGIAHIGAVGPALYRDRALIHVVALDRVLNRERVRALRRVINFKGDRVRNLDRALDRLFAPNRVRALDHIVTRVRGRALISVLTFNGVPALDRNRVPTLVRDFVLALDRDLCRDLDRAIELACAFDDVRDRVLYDDRILGLTLNRLSKLAHGLARGLDRSTEFMEAHDNLTNAASNFIDADLTAVDLDGVDLAGIRWSSNTRWPTPEWAARMRRASVEDPAESGVFIVLPEEGRNFADRGSPAPIS